MKLEQDFTIGRAIHYMPQLKADGKTKRTGSSVRVYFYSATDDQKTLMQLLKFVGAPETAETLEVKILTDLSDDDGPIEWKGYGIMGPSKFKPLTGARAKEQGEHLETVHYLTFPEHDRNDLIELLGVVVTMGAELAMEAKISLRPVQDVLFPSHQDPEPEPEAEPEPEPAAAG